MRLDFNVLWLDDQPERLQSYREQLARTTEGYGFELKVRWMTSLDELKGAFSLEQSDQGVFADELDLVMVDYDLGTQLKGDDALREIRNRLPFKEVIFYSAKPAADLRRLAFEQKVEGVYCASRQDLVDSARWVFEMLIKKVLDVDHSRGIVMGATSDIDHLIHEMVLHIHRTAGPAEAKALRDGIIEKVEEKIAQLTKDAEHAREEEMEALLERYDLITAATRLRIVSDYLKVQTNPRLKALRKSLGKYMSNVVPKRNLLAHVRMVLTATGRALRSRDGKSLTDEDLRNLRQSLLEHRKEFHELRELLETLEKKKEEKKKD